MSAPDLETILCHPSCFGLTSASPLQRAICRVLDGLPLGALASCAEVVEAFGGEDAIACVPNEPPAELLLLAGVRTGKSLLAAAVAVRASQTCDLSQLGPGEVPRVSVVSLTLDLAQPILQHLGGRTRAGSALRPLIIGETSDSVLLRHPSGRPVEIKVVAASRAGSSLVARWCAGVVWDEAPRMYGEQDGYVVSLDEMRLAVMGRMLPGAQRISIGSPWHADGPVYDLFQRNFARPSKTIVVVRARADHMNPVTWTEERKASVLAADPRAYHRDGLAQFGSADDAAYQSVWVTQNVTPGVVVRDYVPPTACLISVDASQLKRDAMVAMAGHREYIDRGDALPPLDVVVVDEILRFVPRPGIKLDYESVLDAIAELSRRRGDAPIVRDGFNDAPFEASMKLRGRDAKVVASMGPTVQRERFERLGSKLRAQEVRLLDDPQLIRELCSLRMRLHPGGRVSFEAPRRGFDDLADALALLVDFSRNLPPSGGETNIFLEEHLFWSGSKLVNNSVWKRRRKDPLYGDVLEICPAPSWSGMFETTEQRDQRWARGEFTPLDFANGQIPAPLRGGPTTSPFYGPPTAAGYAVHKLACEQCGTEFQSARDDGRWCGRCAPTFAP